VSTRARETDLANTVSNAVDVSHSSNQETNEQGQRILLMAVASGWSDPLAFVNDAQG
jgi:hypothetical protein